jgi:hypothetical protein
MASTEDLLSFIRKTKNVGGAQTPWEGPIDGQGLDLTNAGTISAVKFVGDGSQLTGIVAGGGGVGSIDIDGGAPYTVYGPLMLLNGGLVATTVFYMALDCGVQNNIPYELLSLDGGVP